MGLSVALLITPICFAATNTVYNFKAVAEQHIVAGYQQLANTTQPLNNLANVFCESKNDKKLAELQAAYITAFYRWQSVQHIRFGPVQYLTREHRFELWPDKRGSVGKHLARLLNDEALLKSDFDISKKSVAVQGFSALERLLYSAGAANNKQCKVIIAITKNLYLMSKNLLADWVEGDSPYQNIFIHPGNGNLIYESDIELASQLLNALHTQLEFMLTQKLDRPLGSDVNKANGKRAEGWRSQVSLLALSHNLTAVQQLYQLLYANKLSDDLAKKIQLAFSTTEQSLKKIELPLKQAVANELQRKQLIQFRLNLSALKQLIARELAAELGLSLGFNSLDGD